MDGIQLISNLKKKLKITQIHNLYFQYYKKSQLSKHIIKIPTYTQNVMYMSAMLCILIGRESKVIKKVGESVITFKKKG